MKKTTKYTAAALLLLVIFFIGCSDAENSYLPEGIQGTPGYVETPGYSKEVFVEGEYAYIVDGEWGFQVIDISNKEEPFITGNIDTGWAWDFYLYGQYGLIADYSNGLVIVDLETKEDPVLLLKEDITVGATALFVDGSIVYIASHTGELIVIDISDILNPFRLSVIKDIGWVYDVYADSGYGYIIFRTKDTEENGLAIYDLKRPGKS